MELLVSMERLLVLKYLIALNRKYWKKFDHIFEYFLRSKLGSSFCVLRFHSCRNHWRLKTMGKGPFTPRIIKLVLRYLYKCSTSKVRVTLSSTYYWEYQQYLHTPPATELEIIIINDFLSIMHPWMYHYMIRLTNR